MLRVAIVMDDRLEAAFEAFKREDRRTTDADAARALLIRGLEAFRAEKAAARVFGTRGTVSGTDAGLGTEAPEQGRIGKDTGQQGR